MELKKMDLLNTLLTAKTDSMADKVLSMTILVVDDEPAFRDIFNSLLMLRGYHSILEAETGNAAVEILHRNHVDLVVTDVSMPEMDGFHLLEYIKRHPQLEHIPVIMVSGLSQVGNVIQSINEGAEDYLMKPVEKELLWARVQSILERKYLRDREKDLYHQLQVEKEKSENILFDLLPRPIAERLRHGEGLIADALPNVSVLFTDLVKFTELSHYLEAEQLVGMLNELFSTLDSLAEEYNLEKIKTIGDAYMIVGGIEDCDSNHAEQCILFAKQGIAATKEFSSRHGYDLQMRIGVHSGPLIAGVIGRKKPMFDVWGQTVNIASRMESHGVNNRIHISESTFAQIPHYLGFVARNTIEVKGVGMMQTYLSPPW